MKVKTTIYWIIGIAVFLVLFYLQALTNSKVDTSNMSPDESWCSGIYCN